MEIGDLVNAHWGRCDWSGAEGVDWGYSTGIIVSEVRDDLCVDVVERGCVASYHITRLELINESR